MADTNRWPSATAEDLDDAQAFADALVADDGARVPLQAVLADLAADEQRAAG